MITAGGGYTSLVIDKEGTDIAKWLNGIGITAFVLKNRLPGEGHADGSNVPLQDGQRAIRIVRSNAAQWDIDPKRIGIVGLSSGGHMASMIGTSYDRKVYEPVDANDAISARPDFMILAYGPHSLRSAMPAPVRRLWSRLPHRLLLQGLGGLPILYHPANGSDRRQRSAISTSAALGSCLGKSEPTWPVRGRLVPATASLTGCGQPAGFARAASRVLTVALHVTIQR